MLYLAIKVFFWNGLLISFYCNDYFFGFYYLKKFTLKYYIETICISILSKVILNFLILVLLKKIL